jgi:hypothetical protein
LEALIGIASPKIGQEQQQLMKVPWLVLIEALKNQNIIIIISLTLCY